MNSASWKAYGEIDPELEAVLPNLPPRKAMGDYPDVPTLRAALTEQITEMVAAGIVQLPDLSGIQTVEIQIPTRDGVSIRAVQYRVESREPGSVVVYFHGGGWCVGMPEMFEKYVEFLTKELGAVIVSVDYRKAPEHVFPTAANDAVDSIRWVAENASNLGADPSKGFLIGGASAGGQLAAIASHQAVDQKLSPPITGVFLQYPNLVHPDAVLEEYKPHYNSWEDLKDAFILGQKSMNFFYNHYKTDPKSHLASPLLWPSGHRGQPPTYFQICGMDPLRDESLIYEYHLREECGIQTKLDMLKGIPHGGPDFLPMLSQSKKSVEDMKAGMRWLLSQSGSSS